MKKSLLSLLFLYAYQAMAQVPLQSAVLHLTNTKCSVCASRNPGFHKNTAAQPDITLLTVHPSSPYAACVLSKQNTADNDALTRKWGVYGATPRLVINGDVIPAAADYSAPALYAPYLGLSSPVSIRVEQSNRHDSIHATVTLKKHAATPLEAALFLGLAEDSVFVDGGNGETEHYNVLRKSLAGAEGMPVALNFPVGDSVILHFSGGRAPFWNSNRMFAVALLYGKDDQKLIQSGRSSPSPATVIPAFASAASYTVWPNPAHNLVMIRTAEKGLVDYRMYDLLGKSVREGSFTADTKISVAGLPSGPYLLFLYSGSHVLPYRLLLQH